MKTLTNLHIKHFQQNVKTIFNDPLTNRNFIKTDHITCVWYYKHWMNCFHKLFKNIDVLFGKVQD
jgi:hypothetical protein